MESAGSAIVDFGRFATAFLVVMGIGKLSCRWDSFKVYELTES